MTRRAQTLAAAGVLATAAVVHTWPLATAPATLSRFDNADAQLNAWIVAWIGHALRAQPLRLFDANIFYPEPRSLAFSEPLLVPGVLGAPLAWLGASPLLELNLLTLLGFLGTGLAGFLALRRLTGDAAAGLFFGATLAFNAQTLSRLPHLQAQWAFGFPLALLAQDELLRGEGRRAGARLGLWVALLTLTSGYWGALVAVALACAALVRPREVVAPQALTRIAGAAAFAIALTLPLLMPYWRAHREQGLTRTLGEAASFSSTWRNFFSTPSRLYWEATGGGLYQEQGGSHFPGAVVLALAGVALLRPGLRSPLVRSGLAIALAGVALSLGPQGLPYRLLHAAFPPMQGLRDPSRFGYLVVLGAALLAAAGLAALRKRWAKARGAAFAGVLLVASQGEALVAPMSLAPHQAPSPLYARLATEDAAVVAELPFFPASEVYRHAPYVLASTAHWRRLVNGYSGFTPPAFVARAAALRGFPDEAAFAELHRLGVTHLVVHFPRWREPRVTHVREQLAARHDLTLLLQDAQGVSLYQLRAGP
ncbi:MAG: hypothetical protein AB7O37_22035 [Vicinamibacteria bacterium]